MGSIYRRGQTYWIKYSDHGKIIRESADTVKKAVAKGLLNIREGEILQGKSPGLHFDKTTFDELAEEFLMDYKLNKKKSMDRAQRSLNHLLKEFGGITVPRITSPRILGYTLKRQDEGATNATINRELSALKRLLNLGAQQTPPKVDRVPKITMLKENNVRKGFFEHGDFIALRDAIDDYLKGLITFAYKTGMRLGEIRGLTWEQVDFQYWTIRLEVGMTKNDEGRVFAIGDDEELKKVFSNQWADNIQNVPYVFPNKNGNGKIKDFRGAWNTACESAGIGKRLFHDFRRTAVRNMIRAGIPENVAMKISGHKTRSVFDRYNIVNEADIKNASGQLNRYLEELGTDLGTIDKK